MDKLIVTISGIVIIMFIAWFFFGTKRQERHENHH